MTDPVSIVRNGRRTFVKWHRARRRASDPVFTGRRILEGMALGASVEVDLVVHAEHGFAVLHDHLSIARETTGQGPARGHGAAGLRALNLRGNDGAPIPDRVMLLEDLCALLAADPPHPEALLQLDYKEDDAALDAASIASFAAGAGPVARNMILSGGSAEGVRLLADAVPAMRIGYDPCSVENIAALRQSRDYAGFVRNALAASPRAEMIYLSWELVLELDRAGFDIIAAFHAAGRRVDAWTITAIDDASVAVADRLLALGVDQITTDDPEGLVARFAQP
ncbi:MAG TPA: glycerophosphodiester phosphodiesterase [Devosia sp.]|nr:glycerophosphodiester phosphodiesterase [Devosia sp.]